MKATTDLGRLPKKPSDDPRSEISTLLHKFTSDLGRHVEGLPQVIGTFDFSGDSKFEKGFIQSINAAQEVFRIEIRSTAPNFQPFEKKDAQSKHLSRPYFLRSEEGDEASGLEDEDHNGLPASPSSLRTTRSMSRSSQPKVYIDEVIAAAQRYVFRSFLVPGQLLLN